jgi:hypothetical protein
MLMVAGMQAKILTMIMTAFLMLLIIVLMVLKFGF